MTEYPDPLDRPHRFLSSLTPEIIRTYGISMFIVSSILFWLSIMNILLRQLNLTHLAEIYISLIALGAGVLGICTGMNVIINPDWRFVLWFVVPCSFFSLMALIFLDVGYPDIWSYPSISYLSFWYVAGLAFLILSFFVLLAGRSDRLQEAEMQESLIPLSGHGQPVRHLTSDECAHPIDMLGSGALALIGRIEDLAAELEKTKKRSASDQRTVLTGILEVADVLDSIIATLQQRVSEGDTNLKKIVSNFRSVRIKVVQILDAAGVRPIETPDDRANPGTHKILETRIRPDLEDYTIIEEIQKGYVWNGQLLREAIVIVGMKQGKKDV